MIDSATTQRITSYNVTNANCIESVINDRCTILLANDGATYDLNITSNNIVGSSEPTNKAGSKHYFNYFSHYYYVLVVDFNYLTITNVVGIDNVTVTCMTTFSCPTTCYCQIEFNGTSQMEPLNDTEAIISITGLTPATDYSYTVSLVNEDGLPLDNACIMRRSQFNTLMEPGDTSTTSSVSSSSI